MLRLIPLTLIPLLVLPAPATAASVEHVSYIAAADTAASIARDQTQYRNDGVLKGGVTRKNGTYKFHALDAAMHYDRIVTPDAPSLSPGTEPFSYGVRLRVSPHAVWQTGEMAVLRHGDSDNGTGGNYKMELVKTPSGAVAADCVMHDRDGDTGYVRGRDGLLTLADGHFHAVACARTAADTVTLTIDGKVAVGRTTGALGDVSGHARLLVGCQIQPSGFKREQFVGRLDNIHLTVG